MLIVLITAMVVLHQPIESIAAVHGLNDTVLVTEQVRNTDLPEKVTLKLFEESTPPVHIFTTPCGNLRTHNETVNIYSAIVNMSVHGPHIIMPTTYFVQGSSIEVLMFIPETSVIDFEITLHIYSNQATVYTSGPGFQNTSTLVNYTIQSTDYYSSFVHSNAAMTAEFNITLHKQLYHESDYKELCAIAGSAECSLSLPKHECINILAHLANTYNLRQLPAFIRVLHYDYVRIVFPAVGITIIIIVLFCCLAICYKKRRGHKLPHRNNVQTQV